MKKSKYILLCLLMIIPLGFFSSFSNSDRSVPLYCLYIVLLLTIVFFVYQQKNEYKNYWYKPSSVFLFAYVVVNYQYIFDLVLGFKDYSFFLYPNTINTVSVISTYGLIAFMVGYYIFPLFPKIKNKQYTRSGSVSVSKGLLTFFNVSFFVIWVLTVNIFAVLAGLEYADDSIKSGLASNLEGLFYCSTIAILAVVVINSKSKPILGLKDFLKSISPLSWIVILLYCMIRMVSGDRGPFMYTVFAIFYTYIVSVTSRFKTRKLIIPTILLLFALNLIGMARTGPLERSFSERVISSFTDYKDNNSARFSDRTIIPATEELATSIRCNEIAVQIVDVRGVSINHGMFAVIQILQCIPFMPSFLSNILGIPDDQLSTGTIMTDDYLGRHDLYQIGTTVVGDSYMDLHLFGVILILFIAGYLYKWVDNCICLKENRGEISIIIMLLLASMAIYIPRSTLFAQFKNIIPIVVLFYLNKIVCKKKYLNKDGNKAL